MFFLFFFFSKVIFAYNVVAGGGIVIRLVHLVNIYFHVLQSLVHTSKRYSVGARLSVRTWYWCNMSVITPCNLAVSDMYMSVFGKGAPDSL